jgi:flagellar FliL protein
MKRLLPIVLAVIAAAGAGAGGATFLARRSSAPAASAAAGEEAGPEAKAEGHGGKEGAKDVASDLASRTEALEPFLVNLVADDYPRYLKVKVEIELDSPAGRASLAAHLPQVRDVVIGLLSSRRFEDVTSFEGKALLKQDISDRINGVLDQGRVKAVMFTDFVVQ